jgi:simple sugar transport system substrate-binding protein
MSRKVFWGLVAVTLLVFGGSAFAQSQKYEIVQVFKLDGISWFDNMRLGLNEFGKDHPNVKQWSVGADSGDPAKQVAIVEDLIAKLTPGKSCIILIPNDPKSLDVVAKKANEKGIKTIAYEGPNMQNISYDVETYDNKSFGELMMKSLATNMGGKGKYGVVVGLLSMVTHMTWADSAVAYQKKNYPNMQLVTSPYIEDDNNQQLAYQKIQELIKAVPDLRGILGCTGGSTPAAGQVVEEKGLQGKVFVSGLGLPNQLSAVLKSGAVQSAHASYPARMAYALGSVALSVLEGKKVTTGANLGRPGYDKVKVDGKIITANGEMTFTKDNVDQFNF